MKTIIKRVPLRNIVTKRYHRQISKSYVNALLFDIKQKGITNPPHGIIRKRTSKRVYLADGFMRLTAYKKLNNQRPPSRRRKTITLALTVEKKGLDIVSAIMHTQMKIASNVIGK